MLMANCMEGLGADQGFGAGGSQNKLWAARLGRGFRRRVARFGGQDGGRACFAGRQNKL